MMPGFHLDLSPMLRLTLAAALGGFLFGYDSGVVSGAMLKIRDDLNLSNVEQETVVTATIVAAMLSSGIGGYASEFFGRKPVILFAAMTFSVGALVLGFATSFFVLVIGRLIVGVGIGLASLTAPVYIAECALPEVRGRLVTVNILLITLGQFIAGMIDGLLDETEGGWRWMLGLSGIPALAMGCAFISLPESPRWLLSKGERSRATEVLKVLRCTDNVEHEVNEVLLATEEDTRGSDTYTIAHLIHDKPVYHALAVGCGLQALQQFVGINTVMYYSATIYSMAGFSENVSIWLAGYTALAQSIGVSLGILLIEKKGRRSLLLTSLQLVFCSLMMLGLSFYIQLEYTSAAVPGTDTLDAACAGIQNYFVGYMPVSTCYSCLQIEGCGYCLSTSGCYAGDSTSTTDVLSRCPGEDWQTGTCSGAVATGMGWLATFAMVLYLLTFGIGLSSIPWTVNSEIYPQRARSLATSISTSVNWLGNIIISATFLSISEPTFLSQQGAFWLYGIIAFFGTIWVYFALPETAGLSLEDVGKLFEKRRGWCEKRTSGSTVCEGDSALSWLSLPLRRRQSYAGLQDEHDHELVNNRHPGGGGYGGPQETRDTRLKSDVLL